MIKTDAPQVFAPVCGVFAVFLADPDRDFDQVFKFAKKTLGRTEKWQGRMDWYELLKLLRFVGIGYKELVKKDPVGLTIQRAFKEGLFEDGRQYVLRVSGHFLTIRDGLCYDQGCPNGKAIADYRCRRSTITHCAVLK